jgi:lipopolysaccharide transport system permease protein
VALAGGVWLAAINVRYRDVKHAVPFIVQIWLFASPVVYSAAIVPDEFWFVYHLNPMAGAVEGYRWVFFADGQAAPIGAVLLAIVVTTVVLLTGLAYFRRTERTFADVI